MAIRKSTLRRVIREELDLMTEAQISPQVTKLMNKLSDFSGELHSMAWDLEPSKRKTLQQAMDMAEQLKKLMLKLAQGSK